MTQQEIEDELQRLRGQEQARRKNCHAIRRSAIFCVIVFVMGGIGLLAFSIAFPGTRHETFSAAMMFVMLSLPMALLSQALRDPIPPQS